MILLGAPGSGSESGYGSPAMEDQAPTEESKPRKAKPKAEEEISIEDIPF